MGRASARPYSWGAFVCSFSFVPGRFFCLLPIRSLSYRFRMDRSSPAAPSEHARLPSLRSPSPDRIYSAIYMLAWSGCVWLALLAGSAMAQTVIGPTGAIGVETVLGEAIGEGVVAGGGAALSAGAVDSGISAGLLEVIAATEAAAPAAGVGGPISLLALGAVAAGAGALAEFCPTLNPNACTATTAPYSPASGGPYSGGSVSIPAGAPFWTCSNGSAHFSGTDPTATMSQCLAVAFAVTGDKPTQVNITSRSPTTIAFSYKLITKSGQVVSGGASSVQSDPTHSVPVGGLSCASNVFENAPAGPVSCTTALPASSNLSNGSYFNPNPNFTADQLKQPANPQMLADLANAIAQGQFGGSASAYPGGSSLNITTGSASGTLKQPITASDVVAAERATGITPTLADLEQTVALNSSLLASILDNSSPFSIGNLATTNPVAVPCGSVTAGEQPCDETMEFTYDPQTGAWDWQATAKRPDGTEIPDLLPEGSLPNYPNSGGLQGRQRDVTSENNLPDVATLAKPNPNPYVDPQTQLKDIMVDAQPNIQTTTDSPIGPELPFPPITLPFDEWPSVMQQVGSMPDFTGQCPTVSFTVGVLGNKTFTIDAQCVVMNSLKPYMAYVLPPTYLFLAFLLLMAA